MFPKHAIMVSKKGTNTHFEGNTHTKYFTAEQKESGDMQKYIELKTSAGFVVATFNLDAAYGTETNLVKL